MHQNYIVSRLNLKQKPLPKWHNFSQIPKSKNKTSHDKKLSSHELKPHESQTNHLGSTNGEGSNPNLSCSVSRMKFLNFFYITQFLGYETEPKLVKRMVLKLYSLLLSVSLVLMKVASLFYYLAYFCYYSWVSLYYPN